MTRVLDMAVAPGLDAAARVRRSIAAVGGLEAVPQIAFDLCLLVTELVTNSVRHAGLDGAQCVRVIIDIESEHVRCEVYDQGSGFTPVLGDRRGDEESGWGIHLVDRLADRWGVDRRPGTCVWFEIEFASERRRAEGTSTTPVIVVMAGRVSREDQARGPGKRSP